MFDDLTISIDLTSSHVERNLSFKEAVVEARDKKRYGLIARNITVGNDCILDAVSGTVDLEFGAYRRCTDCACTKALDELNASDAEVRGSVVIEGCFTPTKKKSLCFDGGNYLSGFCIGTTGESTYYENKSLKIVLSPNFNSRCNPILSIENARIENNFRVRQVEVGKQRAELM